MFGFKRQRKEIDPATLQPGDKLPDGSFYVGTSPSTGKPLYAAPQDSETAMSFQAAARYARELTSGKHNDWRVPTEAELDLLQKNAAAGALQGTFTAAATRTPYWSAASPKAVNAWCQYLDSPAGKKSGYYSMSTAAVRCVR